MNWTHTRYQLLNSLREPSQLFWTIIYPLLMAFMFFLAFQGLVSPRPLLIKVAAEPGSLTRSILGSVDILEVQELPKEEALAKIRDKTLTGFVDNEFNLIVGDSGISETVLASVTSQIKQMQALDVPMTSYDFSTRYVKTSESRANPYLIPFYSIIGMVSLYSVYLGVEYVRILQANQSSEALRLSISPLKKRDFLLGSVFMGILVNLLANLLLLLFLRYVLNLDLVTDFARSLTLLLCANMLGMGLGLFIGASNNLGEGAKMAMIISSTLFMSFLSGMMAPEIKVYIDHHFPLVSRLNPVNIVTTEMYRINYLALTSTFWQSAAILSAMALAFMLLSLLFLRRKTYDSL